MIKLFYHVLFDYTVRLTHINALHLYNFYAKEQATPGQVARTCGPSRSTPGGGSDVNRLKTKTPCNTGCFKWAREGSNLRTSRM